MWPRTNAKALLRDHARSLRLFSNLSRPISVYSDYSGYASEIEAFSCGFQGLIEEASWTSLTSPFHFERVCDIGITQLHVLKQVSATRTSGRMCVMRDLLDHLTPAAKSHVQAMMPSSSCTAEEARHAYSDLYTWLKANRAMAFPADHKQKCLTHNQMCPVHPSRRNTTSMLANPTYITLAGVTCDGWSSVGGQARFAHASEACHNAFVVERMVRAEQECEDLAFVECTKTYPIAAKLRDPLSATHHTIWVTTGPELFGHPVHRRRVLGVCIAKARMARLGPISLLEVQSEFAELFYKTVMLTGGEYFCGPESQRQEMYQHLAATQTNHISLEELNGSAHDISELLPEMLPVGQLQTLTQWLANRHDFESPGGELVVDLDHNFASQKRGGFLWPTQLTHGTVAHLPRGGPIRLATPLEHLAAQGYQVFTQDEMGSLGDSSGLGGANAIVSPMRQIFERLPSGKVKMLVGRGIHIVVLAAWLYYILSNVAPIHRPADLRMLRGMSLESVDSESDEEID